MKAEGHHAGDQRLAIATQLHGRGFIAKIDGDGPVVAGLASGGAQGAPSGQMIVADEDPRWG
jgi:hypothetical protein